MTNTEMIDSDGNAFADEDAHSTAGSAFSRLTLRDFGNLILGAMIGYLTLGW